MLIQNISSWQSKGLYSDYKLNPKVNYYGTKIRLEFRGSCLKQDKSTFNHGKIVNIYIVYEIDKWYTKSHPALVNFLIGAVSITKNADIDKKNILDMELDLIEQDFICYLAEDLAEM